MGYDADLTKRRGKFYLKTTSNAPFCCKCALNFKWHNDDIRLVSMALLFEQQQKKKLNVSNGL